MSLRSSGCKLARRFQTCRRMPLRRLYLLQSSTGTRDFVTTSSGLGTTVRSISLRGYLEGECSVLSETQLGLDLKSPSSSHGSSTRANGEVVYSNWNPSSSQRGWSVYKKAAWWNFSWWRFLTSVVGVGSLCGTIVELPCRYLRRRVRRRYSLLNVIIIPLVLIAMW